MEWGKICESRLNVQNDAANALSQLITPFAHGNILALKLVLKKDTNSNS